MNDVSRLLSAIDQGDPQAAEQLLPLVYDELRALAAQKLARETPGQTLQPTALVHEAYFRLVGDAKVRWDGRGHFFAAAAEAMRRILVDQARRHAALKRGGTFRRTDWDEQLAVVGHPDDELLALDEALPCLRHRPGGGGGAGHQPTGRGPGLGSGEGMAVPAPACGLMDF
jgi:RNA polymerase sigma factor (TIGR02999 family)